MRKHGVCGYGGVSAADLAGTPGKPMLCWPVQTTGLTSILPPPPLHPTPTTIQVWRAGAASGILPAAAEGAGSSLGGLPDRPAACSCQGPPLLPAGLPGGWRLADRAAAACCCLLCSSATCLTNDRKNAIADAACNLRPSPGRCCCPAWGRRGGVRRSCALLARPCAPDPTLHATCC